MSDLTTLASVKAYLALTSTTQDALISSLIPRASKQIENYVGRRIPSVTTTLRRLNGTGTPRLTLPESPILSISYLAIDGVEIPASSDGLVAGYTFDENTIYLIGYCFPRRPQSVVCSWVAGYQSSEADYVPTGNTPTLTPSNGGRAVENVEVTSAGVALTQVGSGPVAGEYSFTDGTYTFNASNSGDLVAMDYFYVPGPIEQGCIEMVALDLKQRDNIGVSSKSLANESVSYTERGMTTSVKEMLQAYRKVTPT